MNTENPSSHVWLRVLLAAFFAFCIAPFLAACLFAHPSADDWYMAANGRDLGYWAANVKFYKEVTGRFASTALLYLHPMLVSFTLFKVWCALIVISFIPLSRWAFRAWFPTAPSSLLWLGSLAVTALYFWSMPSPAQGLYWGTGIACYTFAGLLAIALAAVLGRRCMDADYRPGVGRVGVSVLLALGITGCTEVGMALLLLHLIVLLALYFWRYRRVSPWLTMVFVATVIGAAIVFAAPGNTWREGLYSNPVKGHLIPALVLAAKQGISHAAAWLSFAPFFLVSLVIFVWSPFTKTITRRQAWELLATAAILIVGTVWGGFFIGTWSTGKGLPPRAINLISLFFVLDWVMLLAALAGGLRAYSIQLPAMNATATAVVLLGIFATLRGPNNVKTAWKDLLTGQAAAYDRECNSRYALIRSTDADDVTVPPLAARPKTLYFNDLHTDPDNWRNQGCASFFRKKVLRLHP